MGTRWNNIIDFIKTFGCRPMLEDLLGDCEIIKPRYFSLTNKIGEDSEILVGIMSKVFEGFVRYGHVSSYLVNPEPGEIQVSLRTNLLFRMDAAEKKLLGICTGTGIAPFLSFISLGRSENILEMDILFMYVGRWKCKERCSGYSRMSLRILWKQEG